MEYSNYQVKQNPEYIHCISKGSMIWCVSMKRWANINELSKLQGITLNNYVSKSKFKGQIGNSMSVPVLKGIFKSNL